METPVLISRRGRSASDFDVSRLKCRPVVSFTASGGKLVKMDRENCKASVC